MKQMTLGLLVGSIMIWSGCKQQESIQTYRVAKSKSGLEDFDPEPTAARPSTTGPATDRMVVAIANQSDATWYFKISGPIKNVEQAEESWTKFLQQVQFNADGKPTWEVPEDWQAGRQAPMRFATLVIGDYTPPLELAVSSLGPGQDPLLNVNRWRRQLNLPPTTTNQLNLAELEDSIVPLQMFDEQGRVAPGGARPPFAGGAARPTARPPAARPPEPPFEFKVPDGWIEGRRSSIVKVRLLRASDDATAQISVTELPADANQWGPNILRWANEIGSSADQDQLQKLTSELEIDGLQAQRLDLVQSDLEQATIGIMVIREQSAWFFKLTGDRQLVADSADSFDQFLQSIQFKK